MHRPYLPPATWESLEVEPSNNYFLNSPDDSYLKPSLRASARESGVLGIQER